MLNLTQSQIMQNWDVDNTDTPLVSVRCITYNHESYITQALDGFIMQKTNFPFEVIIHDDASTDKTADIIREYEVKYPKIIKPIYETENQYSKHDGSIGRIMNAACKGKYIAMCEGDDYWTDENKLQIQVDFLEENPDFSICFHNVKIYKQQEGILVDDFITKDIESVTDGQFLAKQGNYIHTPSVVLRNDERVFKAKDTMGVTYFGDYPLWVLSSQYGKIKKINQKWAVYRFGVGVCSGNKWYNIEYRWFMMLCNLFMAVEVNSNRPKSTKETTAFDTIIKFKKISII